MEEKKKNNIIIFLLVIIILLLIGMGAYLFLNNDNTDNSNTNDKNKNSEIKENNQFLTVPINNLKEKISKLDFSNKTSDTKKEEDFLEISANIINNGQVKIAIQAFDEETQKETERSYTVENINNAVSLGVGISVEGSGQAVTYILTKDGKVFKIEDDVNEIISNENYKGKAKDLTVVNATSIAVVDENFALNDEAETTIPTIYIKTEDDKILTNEYIADSQEQNEIIEVIE